MIIFISTRIDQRARAQIYRDLGGTTVAYDLPQVPIVNKVGSGLSSHIHLIPKNKLLPADGQPKTVPGKGRIPPWELWDHHTDHLLARVHRVLATPGGDRFAARENHTSRVYQQAEDARGTKQK